MYADSSTLLLYSMTTLSPVDDVMFIYKLNKESSSNVNKHTGQGPDILYIYNTHNNVCDNFLRFGITRYF